MALKNIQQYSLIKQSMMLLFCEQEKFVIFAEILRKIVVLADEKVKNCIVYGMSRMYSYVKES